MRRRWHVSDGFLIALGSGWALAWLPIFIIWNAVLGPCDPNGCGMNGPGAPGAMIFLGVWFGVVIVPAMIVGCVLGLCLIWSERPRRVIEPIATDLRANR